MDFRFSEDQEILRQSLGRLLEGTYDFAARQKIVKGGGFSSAMWTRFADLGLLGFLVPEADGGAGGGPVDIYAVMELLGRHLVVEPVLWSGVLAVHILADWPDAPLRSALLAGIQAGTHRVAVAAMEHRFGCAAEDVSTTATTAAGEYLLQGEKPLVFSADTAEFIIVPARLGGELGLFLVQSGAPGLALHALRTLDGGTAARMRLNATPGLPIMIGAEARGILEDAVDLGIIAICAEAIGAMDRLLADTGSWLKTRVQYGSALAQFQALQHRMADMYVAIEQARSLALAAAATEFSDTILRKLRVAAAKARMASCARLVGQQAVQLHGAMGMSEDYHIAHYFKRLTMLDTLFGDQKWHERRFAALQWLDQE